MPGPATPWRATKKAERAWTQAVGLLRQGNIDHAAGLFAEAVQNDPSAADAWLGLHATGRRQQEALDEMIAHAGSFGALRQKSGMTLNSRFSIGEYVTFRLENARDLWLATITELLKARELDTAWTALSEALLDCDETRFVCTRYAFLKNDWPLVLNFARGITGDGFLRDEAQLYVGIALIQQNVHHEALSALAPLPLALTAGSRFDAEVAYFRGRAHEEVGRSEEALKQYQYSFRYWPDLFDVAERAQARPAEPAATPQPTPQPAPPSPPKIPPATAATAATIAGAATAPGPPTTDARELPAAERAQLLADAQQTLDRMVGLEPVKRQVRTLIAQLRMATLREEQGLPSAARPQHFVFAGPPGTGKTTVARIVGKVFAGLGLLKRGHVVEAQRVDLVGQHLGSTAIKTTKIIDSALDGVLFIDEAYALSNSGYSGGDAFGDEALQVLLKRAEDDRGRLVVVLAGYRSQMAELIASNPGLASRFTTRIDFPSYSASELALIARSVLAEHGDTLSPDADAALEARCGQAVDGGLADELGNGRFARELCMKATALRDLRLYSAYASGTPTREEMTTVLLEDVAGAYRELVEHLGLGDG
ncbi:AAA family ATPase [Streptomyces sp. NBC_01142]|uniref:AAA family ATPase n=1 Tax=Streptomyces sp. NBC_01142 TaxID=2975865 RepID=UPI00225AD488|nr:AAA family ATPase [Streptomyces sp. NBC_01142]MCX4820476.1 AAA family ATPase [Streptomyces sp. NBC_01142]